MALEFSQNELDLIRNGTHIVPKTEYSQGDYSALFESFNTFTSLVKRGEYENMEVDVAKFGDVPFSRDGLREHLKTRNLSPEVENQLMMSPIDNWQEAERRIQYLNHYFEIQQQVQERFSTAEMLALGLPMAIIDIDMALTGPTFKAGRALANTLSTRVGKILAHTGTGGVVGMEAMAGYEASTGVYHEDSVTNAFMLGALINGSLSTFTSRANKQKGVTQYKDSEGNIVTKEEAKAEQLANANKELDDINKVIDEVKATQKAQKQATKDKTVSEKEDVGRAKTDNRIVKENLGILKNRAWNLVQATRKDLKKAERTVIELGKGLRKTTQEIVRSEKANSAFADDTAKRKALVKEAAPIKGQITKVTKKLAALEGKTDEASIAKIKDLTSKLTDHEKRLKKVEAKLTRTDTRLAKHQAKSKEDLDLLKNKREAQKIEVNNRKHDRNDLREKVQRELQEHAEAKSKYDNQKLKPEPEEVHVGSRTQQLQAKLEQYEATLSPEGIQKLMNKRATLRRDVERMGDDQFNLDGLYGVQTTRQNAVNKLSRELEDIASAQDFRKSAIFKRLPDWAQKLMITPITKTLQSDNPLVSGFAALLHSGTIHHGKVQTHNAWNVRLELDNRLNRMHKAMIYSYRQAVMNGYSGKLSQFEAEVANQAHQVTGRMQREMFTGIPGDIVGIKRLELAQKKAASIQRTHQSGNEWIDKAVDEYLDYYEEIHKRGQDLDMESFTKSIGKGYIKRVYSVEKIQQMGRDAAVNHLVESQKAFAIATNSAVTPEIMAEFLAKAEKAIDSTLSHDFKIKQVTEPLGLPKQATTSSLKQRSIDAFDDDLRYLLDDDVVGTSNLYGLSVHGRLALKEKLGVDNGEQVEKLLGQLDATAEELDNLRTIIQTITGVREISKNPFDPFTRAAKAASTYSSAMHTLAFAVPTVTEMASMAKEFGWGKTIDSLIGTPKEIYRLYKDGTPSDKNTIEMMVSYGDAYFATKANRFDVESTYDSVGRLQEFMDGVVRREAVFGGLLPLTDMMRMGTAALSVDFLAKMSVSKHISDTDLMRLQDMGFDKADLPTIRKTLKVADDGRIGNTDRKTWGKLDKQITYGVQTMVERTILHPNGATLPKFMTNMNEGQFLPRIMFKFMRFPFESYERLLVRGLQEADAKQLMALGGNIAMWTMILSAKDALKEEDKQKYSGTDGMNQLMMDSFLYNSFTALPISMVDTVTGLATGENLTNDYRYRIGGAPQADYEALVRGNPSLAVPFTKINIGDAVANAMASITGLEELNREE